jgi:hypothetical protein
MVMGGEDEKDEIANQPAKNIVPPGFEAESFL